MLKENEDFYARVGNTWKRGNLSYGPSTLKIFSVRESLLLLPHKKLIYSEIFFSLTFPFKK